MHQQHNAVPLDRRVQNLWRCGICGKRKFKTRRSETEETAKRKRGIKATSRDTKKSSGILCERNQRRLDFAKKELSEYDTDIVCRVLQVSKSGYHSHKIQSDCEITEIENVVINCFKKHDRNYGRIRIRKELLNEGTNISEYRIAKILKKYGLVAKSGRTGKPKPPKPTEQQYIEENLIKDKFAVKEPNYLWCSDITELSCYRQKLYLCGIIDVATRRLVGWDIAKHQRQEIVQNAFNMAVGRNPNRKVV